MSSFNGQIQEIPHISIDHFENNDQQFYFLSHCHADHLKGIEQLTTDAPFFATPISSFIIKRKYPKLEIQELEIGYAKNLEVYKDDGTSLCFTVTALSAGHCMGACMLLFQIEGCDILYTGDIRVSLNNLKNLKPLKEARDYGHLVIYLDSTFMKKKYAKFPTHRESIAAAIEVVNKHLKASSSHKVHLQGSARYGYERLLMEMSKELKEKIYVMEDELSEQYSSISEINGCITKDLLNARVFLKPKYSIQQNIPSEIEMTTSTNKNVMTINFSAMYWENYKAGDEIVRKLKDNYVRICYSTHSSLEEIKDFLTYLKPKKVNLNVIPVAAREKYEMMNQLKEIQKNYMPAVNDEEQQEEGRHKKRFKRFLSKNFDTEEATL